MQPEELAADFLNRFGFEAVTDGDDDVSFHLDDETITIQELRSRISDYLISRVDVANAPSMDAEVFTAVANQIRRSRPR